jgi:hypothetical protein
MSSFPGSPRLLKGALVAVDPANPPARVIAFQYNSDTLTRRLEARASGGGDNADRTEALRLMGPPKETITMTVEFDATDGLEAGDPQAAQAGVYPILAALETLIYPKSSTVIANVGLAQGGVIEIVPPDGPLTVLVWGPKRVVPVRLSSFSITEEAYDPQLNPIRAKAELTLHVLTYFDLPLTNPGYNLFLAHQTAKEVLASNYTSGAPANLGVNLNF